MQHFREQFPICQNRAYFNSAALGPFCIKAQQSAIDWANQQALGGSYYWFCWFEKMMRAIPLAAKLINAQPEEIALTRSTSEGIKLVAEGYPWRPGDNVVFPENEFPANIYPWTYLANRGVEPRPVPLPDGKLTAQALEPYINSHTRIVALSWVSYSTGWRANLEEIAQMVHSHGALLFVDAIQGLGAFPLDVRQTNIDFLSAGAQKWLLSAQGSGLFFCKKELNSLLRNINFGWASVENCTDYSRSNHAELNNAQRFMTATANTPAWITLTDSLDLLLTTGIENIAQQILQTKQYLIEQLNNFPVEWVTDISDNSDSNNASGIIFYRFPGISSEKLALISNSCVNKGVELTHRAGGFRASIHGYNNQSDVDRLIDQYKTEGL